MNGGESKIVGFGSPAPESGGSTKTKVLGWLSKAQDVVVDRSKQLKTAAETQMRAAKEQMKHAQVGQKLQAKTQALQASLTELWAGANRNQTLAEPSVMTVDKDQDPKQPELFVKRDRLPTVVDLSTVHQFRDPDEDDLDEFFNEDPNPNPNPNGDEHEIHLDQIPIAALHLEPNQPVDTSHDHDLLSFAEDPTQASQVMTVVKTAAVVPQNESDSDHDSSDDSSDDSSSDQDSVDMADFSAGDLEDDFFNS
eukprot:TRINITY_DN16583_c0_g1_i4.p1 TRINITY_DN16583_c0_g1~~TRINITY_DN16583_c0_g1_i4.p1  ORF type:complete len:252 (-),score=69.13 TRINITY_DN16583_c0_g1_i4:207-962(-)